MIYSRRVERSARRAAIGEIRHKLAKKETLRGSGAGPAV